MLAGPPPLLPTKLWLEEARNSLNVGRKNQIIDAGGALLGAFFIAEGWRRRAWLNIGFGALMLYLHGYRFLVGDRIDPCSLCQAEKGVV